MKIIFTTSLPFHLAHGGTQTVAEALIRELPQAGVEVELERWWDDSQSGDLIHHIGRPPSATHIRLAHEKGFKVIMTEFLDKPASRSKRQLFLQRQVVRLVRRFFSGFTGRLAWDVYRELDAMIFAVTLEGRVAHYLFDANVSRTHIIPHGLDERALEALRESDEIEDYIVSVATITERKGSVALAEAALAAQVPVMFVGKPYGNDHPYFKKFMSLVDNRYVRYAGFVSEEEKYRLVRRARGFALLSSYESGCVAVYEAAGAGLPLVLPQLPWATDVYHEARDVRFVDHRSCEAVASALNAVRGAPQRTPGTTFPLLSWKQVAEKYIRVYEQVLRAT